MVVRVVFILVLLGIAQCNLIQSCDITRNFVEYHNALRYKLTKGEVPGQPAAAKMNLIVWDEELASKASNWAAKYQFAHNPDMTIPSRRFETGENVLWFGTSNMTYQLEPYIAMDSWWNEYKDFTYHALSPRDFSGPKKIGHYTQMAWSDSTRLGCGMSQYFEDGLNNFIVVCDYGPAGNMVGETPYESGKPSGILICQESDCSKHFGDKCDGKLN